jgi:hypothetical protein
MLKYLSSEEFKKTRKWHDGLRVKLLLFLSFFLKINKIKQKNKQTQALVLGRRVHTLDSDFTMKSVIRQSAM